MNKGSERWRGRQPCSDVVGYIANLGLPRDLGLEPCIDGLADGCRGQFGRLGATIGMVDFQINSRWIFGLFYFRHGDLLGVDELRVWQSLVAVLRFLIALFAVIVLEFLLSYLLTRLPPYVRFPTTLVEREGHWYLLALGWAVIVMAGVFAILFDYPRFRPWHRLDKALIAGFITVNLPPFLNGLYDRIQPGEPVVPWYYVRLRVSEDPAHNLALNVSFHVLIALILCNLRCFAPSSPKLLPFGFLYRYVLVAGLTVLFYFYLFLTMTRTLGY